MGKTVLDESRWDGASKRVSTRTESSKSEFELALEKEQSRENDLDDLFKKAQERALRAKKGKRDDS